jgi:hypothetical protein
VGQYDTNPLPADRSQAVLAESLDFDRIAFAYCPPRNDTANVAAGEKPAQFSLRDRAFRSLKSGLSSKYHEKWACFVYFGVKGAGVSLQLRLAGGESGIRNHAGIENKGSR